MTYDRYALATDVALRLDIPDDEAMAIVRGVERDLVALEWERADSD